ncbi:MAG: hypothetical protein H6577_10125 [Lewinellaceae bacterium]|nr:hypothetical protein [Saprospiraceae bacterium]MCB9338473.1 hypothetical protein [Lewinellaceae bacterium]
MTKITKFSIALSLLAFSCTNNPPQDKYDAMAKDLCSCMKPMMELQNEMMQVLGSGNQDGMAALMEKAQQINTEGEACVAELEKKHGTINGAEEEAKAMEALRKACPDIVAAMEQTAAPNMMEGDLPMEEEGMQGVPEDTSEE